MQTMIQIWVLIGAVVLLAARSLGDEKPPARRVVVEVVGATDDPERGGGGVTVSGNYAYLCAPDNRIIVVDVSNPRVPRTIGSIPTSETAKDVAIQKNHAFIAGGTAGLRIVDVSDPKTPKDIGVCTTPGIACGVAVEEKYAYVADARKIGMEVSGLRIIDVENPKAPKLVGSFDRPKQALGVALRGKHAYVADKAGTLWVADVSEPTNPKLAGSWDFKDKDLGTSGEPQSLVLAGNYALIADDDSAMHIVDISDPKAPFKVSTVSEDTGDFGEAVAVVGNLAYVADTGGVIVVYDIARPERPLKVASYDLRAEIYSLTAAGGNVYANVAKGRLVILRALSGDAELRRGIEEHIRSLGNRETSRHAEAGLVRIGTPAVPYLIDMLKDPLKHRRAFAANVLSKIAPDSANVDKLLEALLDNLKESPSAYRDYYAGALGTLPLTGDKATSASKTLIEMSGTGQQPMAAESIARIGGRGENAAAVVPMLLEALKDKRWQVRWTAVAALREIGPRDSLTKVTVPALTNMLKDEEVRVRREAGLALKVIDPAAARMTGLP